MKKKIIILLIVLIAILRVLYTHFIYSNNEYNKYKRITGIVTFIKESKDKTTLDVLSKNKIRITIYKNCDYEYGDEVLLSGYFKNSWDNTVFNTFNYNKYLLSKKVKYISINPNIKITKRNNNVFYKVKNLIINKIRKYKSYKYLSAFILGDKSLIEESTKDNYRNICISHLFSISGMHIGVLLFVINHLIKKERIREIIILIFLVFLLFITNYTESLLRCACFITLALANKKLKLGLTTEALIIVTASLLFIYNPYLIYSVGFIFSVLITYFVIISKKIINGNYFIRLLKLSLICFLSSLPIIAFSFYKVNLLSPIINTFLIPIVSVIIFPLGLITFFIPFLDKVFYYVMDFFELVTSILSSVKFMTFSLAKPSIIVIFLYYIILYLSIKKKQKYIVVFIIILFIHLNISFFITKPRVIYLDVGQGDSSLIIYPKGKTVLIDTGGKYGNYSIVKNSTIPLLNSLGINKLSSLIITHGDFDHLGEAINLVENFKVEKVIFNCGPYNDLEKELIKVLDKRRIKYYSCIKELNIAKNKLYFLQTKEYDNENDNSNVIYTELNGYKFMFMGDASITTEKEILNKYNLPDIDVLKVGHHGSRTSSGKDFIDEINPKYSIVSVGKNNRYGHPNKEVLDNLANSKIYRTDENGSIMFKIKNNKLKIETCSP